MNEKRRLMLYKQQTSIAKKVYDTVPMQEAWTANDIIREMMRTGINVEKRTVTGCLVYLADCGLIAGSLEADHWSRVQTREAHLQPRTQVSTANGSNAPPTSPPSDDGDGDRPIDQLADIAAQVAALATTAVKLAKRIEAVALDIEEQMNAADTDTERLRQLRSLLKEI